MSPGFNWCRFGVDEEDHGSILRLVVHAIIALLADGGQSQNGNYNLFRDPSALLAYKFSRQLSFEGQEVT